MMSQLLLVGLPNVSDQWSVLLPVRHHVHHVHCVHHVHFVHHVRCVYHVHFVHTPSQCNSQRVLFSCSLPPAWSDPCWGQLQANQGFLGARWLATRGFQNGGCSFKIQPPSSYFHKDFAPFFKPQHLWDVISCLLTCQTVPWHLLVKSDSSNLCFVRL